MQSGADLFLGQDQSQVLLLLKILATKAAEARNDPKKFFEFAFVSEHDRRAMRIAPHQKVLMDFWLAHDRSVSMLPLLHSKTFCACVYILWKLGLDPTTRVAIVSATQDQAIKPLRMLRDYIEGSDRLHAVFPDLVKSERPGDPWTQTAITVKRPSGIRDPSIVAIGVDSERVAGSRWNLVFVDDILSEMNTSTPESRIQVCNFYQSEIHSRLDRSGGVQVIVTNTARHPDDLPHKLVDQGWPLLKMNVMGGVYVRDDSEREILMQEPWDSDELVPALDLQATQGDDYGSWCRLKDWKPGQSLWWDESVPHSLPMTSKDPKRKTVEKEQRQYLPIHFAQLFMQECRDDQTAMCQVAWINACKLKARQRGIHTMMMRWDGESNAPRLVFTGVDLAIGVQDVHDDTCFFTFAVLADGHRQILDIDLGKFTGPQIRDKLREKAKQFDSIVVVENVGAQDYIKQFVLEKDISTPIKTYSTNRDSKVNPTSGIPGIFVELYNGAWLIPNDRNGRCHPFIDRWCRACLDYVPTRHADDTLMASLFGWDLAKKWGVLGPRDPNSPINTDTLGMSIMAR